MKLLNLTLPLSIEEARNIGLIFTQDLVEHLSELHSIHGSPNLIPILIPLTDGRLVLNGDILTEVIPWKEIVPLIPV
jgi:hypothetical protein